MRRGQDRGLGDVTHEVGWRRDRGGQRVQGGENVGMTKVGRRREERRCRREG